MPKYHIWGQLMCHRPVGCTKCHWKDEDLKELTVPGSSELARHRYLCIGVIWGYPLSMEPVTHGLCSAGICSLCARVRLRLRACLCVCWLHVSCNIRSNF